MQRSGLRATVGGVAVDVPTGTWTSGQALRYNAGIIDSFAPGDVVGPGVAVNGNIASFNGTTGKLLQDSGVSAAAHGARHKPNGADSIATGTFSANDVLIFDGTNVVPKYYKVGEVSSAFTGAGTGLTDITGLAAFSLPRAGTYWCEFSLNTNLATSAQLIAAGINVSANFTRCSIQVLNFQTTTALTAGCQVLNNTATASASRTTFGTNLPVLLTGTVTVSGAATLACRIQRAANTLTVAAGSGGMVLEL